MPKIYLGLHYNRQGKLIMHRSLLKILLNPIIMVFGYTLASVCEPTQTVVTNYKLIPNSQIKHKGKPRKPLRWNLFYKEPPSYAWLKRRTIY
jgi:hypothetical protein